jgi:hypothetical protein
MNQTKYSLPDFKQETLSNLEDSHFPFPGNSIHRSTSEIYTLRIPYIKTSSFIVDWQLPYIGHQNEEKPLS